MSKANRKPILVTGAHRSGTTWVGKVLSASPDIGYIEEPFNPGCRHYDRGTCKARFDYYWTYVTEENEGQYYADIASTLEFRYHLLAQLRRVARNKSGLRTTVKGYSSFALNRYVYNARPLVKDPIALFSTEWMAKKFNMDVVILIRHPAAFVSSIKRMNWPHYFAHFLEQPLLIRDYLSPLEGEIRQFATGDHDIIDEAILLWRMFYYFVHRLRETRDDFIYIKHEELSRRPAEEFRILFDRLNIEFTPRIESMIVDHSNPSNPSEVKNGVMHQLKRDSRANVTNWKRRLTPSEIDRIQEGVKDVYYLFYKDEDW